MADEQEVPTPETTETTEATTEEKKSSKTLLFLGVGFLLLLGLGAGAWMALSGSEEPGIEGEEEVEEVEDEVVEEETRAEVHALFQLEGFVVNLADTERNSFLRIGIELGLEHEPEAGHEGGDAVPTARMRDAILAVLSTWESDALLTQEGKAKLKEQLVEILQERVPEMGVQEVYFTDFLVQR